MRILIFICIALFIGCESTVDPNGKYIASIERNTITLDNNESFDINTDDGSKVFFLVRHAEKDTLPKTNPILTKQGYKRSHLLAQLFKSTRVDAVYSTIYNRTIHTADSLATSKALPTKMYKPGDMKAFVKERLEDESEKSVVIVGHSNTTPAIAGVFMEEKVYEHSFEEDDYDNLLVVNILPNGEKKLFKLKYGRMFTASDK